MEFDPQNVLIPLRMLNPTPTALERYPELPFGTFLSPTDTSLNYPVSSQQISLGLPSLLWQIITDDSVTSADRLQSASELLLLLAPIFFEPVWSHISTVIYANTFHVPPTPYQQTIHHLKTLIVMYRLLTGLQPNEPAASSAALIAMSSLLAPNTDASPVAVHPPNTPPTTAPDLDAGTAEVTVITEMIAHTHLE